jgi:transposase-like protein
MEAALKARLKWVDLYKETGDAGYVCRRCGISRPTLRKWLKCHQENGVNGLVDRSRKPRFFPTQKVNQQITEWILELRNERNLGSRRIQSELFRQYECSLSVIVN